MRKILATILILGFLVIDFLLFHDILKPGEIITPVQYATGLFSVLVFILSVLVLTDNPKSHTNKPQP